MTQVINHPATDMAPQQPANVALHPMAAKAGRHGYQDVKAAWKT